MTRCRDDVVETQASLWALTARQKGYHITTTRGGTRNFNTKAVVVVANFMPIQEIELSFDEVDIIRRSSVRYSASATDLLHWSSVIGAIVR